MEAEAAGRQYNPMLSWYQSASFLDGVITLRKNRDSLPGIGDKRPSTSVDLDTFLKTPKSPTASPPPVRKRLKQSKVLDESPSVRVQVKPEDGNIAAEDDLTYETFESPVDYERVEVGDRSHYDDECTDAIEIVPLNRSQTYSVQTSSTTTTANVIAKDKDEISLFCDLMDRQLRALPSTTVLEAMCKIQTLVMEARLQAMSQNAG